MPILEEEDDVPVAPADISMPPTSRLPHRPAPVRILHSSMAPFTLATQDQEFPSFPRALGVIVRFEKSSSRHSHSTLLIEQEWPTLTSMIRGEESSRETVEPTTRQYIRELITRCRDLAAELTSHANRLEKVASRNLPLIQFGEDETSTKANIASTPLPVDLPSRKARPTPGASNASRPPKPTKPGPTQSAPKGLKNLLDLLDEDD